MDGDGDDGSKKELQPDVPSGGGVGDNGGRKKPRDRHDVPSDDDDYFGESKSDGSDPGVVMVTPIASPRTKGGADGGAPDAVAVDDEGGEDDDDKDDDQFEDSILAPEVPRPPSFVQVGLQRKASPWKLQSWIALSLTLDGRDKITKVLQYVSRFLAWWFVAYGVRRGAGSAAAAAFNRNQAARFAGLCKELATSRKAFRLGRSVTEMHKIASMGFLGLLGWHLRRHIDRLEGNTTDAVGDGDGDASAQRLEDPPKIIVRRASSNTGWGPMTLGDADADDGTSTSKRTLYRSLSNMAYRKMYRPLMSRVSSTFGTSSETPKAAFWTETGVLLKIVGLLGFWLGDNVNFLASSGAFDDYSLKQEQRLARRKRWQTFASEKANQAYFFGALAGLVTNAYVYFRFQKDKLEQARRTYQEMASVDVESEEEQEYALKQLKKLQEKQFSFFLALLKSCMDVAVFSNNPGIDWHQKLRGHKNNEGLHCLCGLISAGTVLYNNFPDAPRANAKA